MEENKALKVVDALRGAGRQRPPRSRRKTYQIGVRIVLGDGREAVWDTDDTPGLEAQVMRDGMLVGYVPQIPGSENFDFDQVVAAIAGTDAHDQPIATRSSAPRRPAAPLAPEGGVFRRFLGGFRER